MTQLFRYPLLRLVKAKEKCFLHLRRQQATKMKIFSTQFYHHENTLSMGSFGSSTLVLIQLQELMSSISKNNLIKSFRKNKLERLVSALKEKSFMHSALMSSFDRSQFHAQSKDFS